MLTNLKKNEVEDNISQHDLLSFFVSGQTNHVTVEIFLMAQRKKKKKRKYVFQGNTPVWK